MYCPAVSASYDVLRPHAAAFPLAPPVAPVRTPLRFIAPKKHRARALSGLLPDIHLGVHKVFHLHQPFPYKHIPLKERDGDIISRVQKLDLVNFSNDDAVWLTSPVAPHSHIMDEVLSVAFERMKSAPRRCRWNDPKPRPEWDQDLRLSGEWWLSLRSLPSDARVGDFHPPLIPWVGRNEAGERQFIADVSSRMKRCGVLLSLLHVDHMALPPERISVLLYDGILCNGARALECLSVPFCEIGAASLLVMLDALTTYRSLQPLLRVLNLSYNWIDTGSAHMLAMFLPRTSVRRLSLRGNRFGGDDDTETFEEFLLHGCALLRELDLGYTGLSLAEVCTLIRCIPQMNNLRVLLLDGIDVPASKAAALSAAIRRSRLTYVSLKMVFACSGAAYLDTIEKACQRNRGSQRDVDDLRTLHHLSQTGSFFEAFALCASEWTQVNFTALPQGYRPFTTNEPSLVLNEESI